MSIEPNGDELGRNDIRNEIEEPYLLFKELKQTQNWCKIV